MGLELDWQKTEESKSLKICCSRASQLVTKNPPDGVVMENNSPKGCTVQKIPRQRDGWVESKMVSTKITRQRMENHENNSPKGWTVQK